MKTAAVTAFVVGALSIGGQVFAYTPYVNGHKTVATPNAVVIGGQTFEVKADPKTVEEMQNKVTWLEAQIDEIETNRAVQASVNKSACAK